MVVSAEAFEQQARARIEAAVPGVDLDVFAAFFGLSRVTSRLIADFESVIQRPRGLSWAGFRTLFCLWVAGPLQTGDLARLLFTTAPSVSSVVNTLEGRRWVRRERLDHDRRLVRVRLTPTGGRLIRSVFRAQHEREVAWVADLTAEDLAGFVRVVEHIATRPRPVAAARSRGRAAEPAEAGVDGPDGLGVAATGAEPAAPAADAAAYAAGAVAAPSGAAGHTEARATEDATPAADGG